MTYKTPGAVNSYSVDGRTLTLDCNGPKVAISVLTPSMIRVRLAPDGEFAPRRSWAVNCPDDEFPLPEFQVDETKQMIVLRTDELSIRIRRNNCHLRFVTTYGREFFGDTREGMQWGDEGIAFAKKIFEGEGYYGFGERAGPLNKRGHQLTNWAVDATDPHGLGTDAMYIAIPVFMGLQADLAWGVYFNNTWRSQFDVGYSEPDVLRITAEGGELDYTVIYGPTPTEFNQKLGMLLGNMPLPPLWALGYHQSRWSYRSTDEVRHLAANFRQHGFPCDAIHLDIDYMDGYRLFTWNKKEFPDPKELSKLLQQYGFHLVPIIDAGVKVDPKYSVYKQGADKGYFVQNADGEIFTGYVWPDESAFPDFMRADVRKWWGKQIDKFVKSGIGGIWCDMNEPTVFEKPFSEGAGEIGTIDLDAIQGDEDEHTTHAEVHNLYGSNMARATYEGLRKANPEQRPFVLTRSGFAGVQRWSACWMGDNHSWWEHLEMAIPQLLNMGISGVPFVGVDIGGFHSNATGELFTRFMQFGMVMPFARGHSVVHTVDHEPWAFGLQYEGICRDHMQMRYRFLPYLYSLFWEASQRGTPILRPLFYHHYQDPKTFDIYDQALLGEHLMVAPIYRPNSEHRMVYLPAGDWYDWWTNERITGPTTILAEAKIFTTPLYVRAGGILPSGAPALDNTTQYRLAPLTLDVYPGDGDFTLYEDAGDGFAYQDGEYATTHIELKQNNNYLIVDIHARDGDFIPPERQIIVSVHDVEDHAGRAAQTHPNTEYDSYNRTLTITFDDDGAGRMLRVQLR